MKNAIILMTISLLMLRCNKGGDAVKFSQVTGTGGSLARFTIIGNYLYTADNEDLKVFNISEPSDPILANTISLGFGIETIFPFKDKLFIGSTSVVYIFSLEDPARPLQLSQAISPNTIRRCDPVVAKDSFAFATLRTSGPCGGAQSILAVFNISDISNPVQIASLPMAEPYGLGYEGDILYVCDYTQGLRIIDIADPSHPLLKKTLYDDTYVDVIPYGQTLICWVKTGMIIYDITDKTNPTLLAKIN